MLNRQYQSSEGSIEVNFASPIEYEGRWFCELQITSEKLEDVTTKVWGVDSLDALLEAINIAKILLESFYNDGVAIEWLGQRDFGLSLR